MDTSDLQRDTLLAFRSGDRLAFGRLIEARWSLVWSVVSRLSKSAFEREDLAQQAWLHIFEKRSHLDPERLDHLDGWLLQLGRNRCLDILRASGRQRNELDLDEAWHADPTPSSDPESCAEDAELGAAVEAFARSLPPDQGEFFRLHFASGLPLPACAERLGVPLHRCKYLKRILLQRARRHGPLLEALGRDGEKL